MQKYREPILYIVLVLILCYAALMQIKPKIQNFITYHRDITQKKQTAEQLKSQLDASKAQFEKIERARIANGELSKVIFQPLTLSLDNESGYSVMFKDIFEMAKNNHIKTFSIEYEYDPQDDPFVAAKKGYNVCLMKMKVIGDYTDFENFLTDLYKYPYFLSISSYDLVPYYKNKNILLIKLGIKVYMIGDGTSTPTTQSTDAMSGGIPAPPLAATP